MLPEVLFEEVDADGLLVVAGEDAFTESLNHTRLADGAVADNHHLRSSKTMVKHSVLPLGGRSLAAHITQFLYIFIVLQGSDNESRKAKNQAKKRHVPRGERRHKNRYVYVTTARCFIGSGGVLRFLAFLSLAGA